jgi:hypothetical protein
MKKKGDGFMTKQEVLQGALALNGEEKDYTVAVDGDRIIIERKHSETPYAKTAFRYIALLKNNNTYIDAYFDKYGVRIKRKAFKKAARAAADSTDSFNSGDIKKILSDYLISCRYRRSNKAPLIAFLLITLPVLIATIIAVARVASLLSAPDFVDTNGPDDFSLTEITRDEILSPDNSYQSFMSSQSSSGSRTKIDSAKLRPYDYDKVTRSFGKFNGVTVLQATKIPTDTLMITIDSSVESGNAEIIIMIDGEYYRSVDLNRRQYINLKDVENKEVVVKLAGEGAKVKVEVARTYTTRVIIYN